MELELRNRPPGIIFCLLWVVIVTIWVAFDMPWRPIVGLPMLLFIPGYLLVLGLFPDRGIDLVERMALSFGLSVGIVSLVGLVLNYTPWGIHLESILVSVGLLVGVFAAVGYYRWKLTLPPNRFMLSLLFRWPHRDKPLDFVLTIALALSISVTVLLLGYLVVTTQPAESFTELYLLGPEGNASNYPAVLKKGEQGDIVIGVVNHEHQPVNYTLEIWLVNQSFNMSQYPNQTTTDIHHVWFMNKMTLSLPPINGNGQQRWISQYKQNYSFSINRYGMYKLAVLLYKGETQPYNPNMNYTQILPQKMASAYRQCHLWVNIPVHKYTDFYIRGPMGETKSLSEWISRGDSRQITVGIHNHEYQLMNYTIEAWLVKKTSLLDAPSNAPATVVHAMHFLDKTTITLPHKENRSDASWNPQYQYTFPFTFDAPTKKCCYYYEVLFLLYKGNTSTYDYNKDYGPDYWEKITKAHKKCSYVIAENIGETRLIHNVSAAWTEVNFWQTYRRPVIVSTYNLNTQYDNATVVRVRNVTGQSCEIKLQSPGGSPNVSDVHLIIVEEGSHTLFDGRKMEAHTYLEDETASKDNWDAMTEQHYSHYYSEPAVFGQIMSYNNEAYSVFWCCNGTRRHPPDSTGIFTGKHVGEDSDIDRKPETIGYMVIEKGKGMGTGVAGSIDYAVGSYEIFGVENASEGPPQSYRLTDNFSIGVASINGMQGGNGGWALLYGNNPVSDTINLTIMEDTILDEERVHRREHIGYLVFSKEGNISTEKNRVGETRKIKNVGTQWRHINFWNTYTDPVIVTTYNHITVSHNETLARITNVTSMGCDIKLQHINGAPMPGDVHLLIMEKGAHILTNGVKVEAQKYVETTTTNTSDWTVMTRRNYTHNYSTPVVVGQVMSYNDRNFSVFWCSNCTSIAPPDSNSLYTGKHVGEDTNTYRRDEVIGYIVWEQSSGHIDGIHYEASRGDIIVEGIDVLQRDPPYTKDLPGNYTVGGAAINGMRGVDGGWAVLYGKHPVSHSIKLAIDEDTLIDLERGHYSERAVFWVFTDEGFIASASG